MEPGGPGGKIARHGIAQHRGDRQKFGAARSSPNGKQAADHDPAIEEIGKRRRVELKREHAGCRVPGRPGEEASGGERAVQIALVTGERVQVDERAGGVPGDFGRDRVIPLQIGTVIAGDAAGGFLNAGAQKPVAGAGDKRKQTSV
jgi:hypothetical protein